MIKKYAVFNYLDILFKDTELIVDDIKFKIINNKGNTICSTSVRNGKVKGFHFSNREFYFILNMYTLDTGQAVDYIKEYMSNKLPSSLFNDNLPFFPYL
jgi:hypothetical protein